MRFILACAFCLYLPLVFGQINSDSFSINNINYEKLEQLFLQRVNVHRNTLKLKILMKDPVLKLAATNQANYCKAQNKVTHIQQPPSYLKNPVDRVAYYNGSHAIVGENILTVSLLQPILINGKIITLNTYSGLTDCLFDMWKNSPPHYKNMISNEFVVSGLGFAFNSKNGYLFATEVFGSMPFIPLNNGLKYDNNTYGIRSASDAYCNYDERYADIPLVIANYIHVENNKVYLYFRHLDYIKKIIQDDSDGFALDIVYKEQFTCNGADNLHGSPIFDGKLLPPVYKKQLFSKNEYASTNELYTKLCELPKDINKDDYQINLITLKNNKLCAYSFPVNIESGLIESIEILPLWSIIEGKIETDTVNIKKTLNVAFSRSETNFDWDAFQSQLQNVLKVYIDAVDTLYVNTHSSIEGNVQTNIKLQEERADKIRQSLVDFLPGRIVVKTISSENWDLFYKQIENTTYKTLFKNKSADEIRKYINQHKDDATIKKWLEQQRTATINIKINEVIDENTPPEILHIGLYNAIRRNKYNQANIISSKMAEAFKNNKINSDYIVPAKVPLERKYLPAINNYISAKILSDLNIKINNSVIYLEDDYQNTRNYIDSAYFLFKDDEAIRFNCIIDQIYQAKQTSDYDPKKYHQIEKQILAFKESKTIDKNILNSVLYNYYLEGSVLYYELRDYNSMDTCIFKIKPFLKLDNLNASQVYEVCKYFNVFYNFEVTQQLLERYLIKYPDDKRLLYLYASTGAFYNLNYNYKISYYYEKVEQFCKKDKPSYCNWINQNFQLLRDPLFKTLFCKNCKL